MDAFGSIRKGKIQEVKSKIFRKLYDTKELKEETVNKLVQSEDLRKEVYDFNLAKREKGNSHSEASPTGKGTPKTNLSVREKKIKEAKEKNQRGYYNNPEVFSKIAQRLIDLFRI
jgi:alanyl-tRNA synthetase